MNNKYSVIRRLRYAFRGYFIWKKIQIRHKEIEKYIIFPEISSEYNFWGLKFLPEYVEKKNIKKYVVIYSDSEMKQKFSNTSITKICFPENRIQMMLCYYALADMSSKWTVVSVKLPYNTKAENLLGRNGVTKREIVQYDIYQIEN